MSPVIPFRRRSRYPRVPFALGVLAAIALGAAAIAAWMIWQRSSVSPFGQIIEVIDGDTVRLNGAVIAWSGSTRQSVATRRAATMNAAAPKQPPRVCAPLLAAAMPG